MHRLLRYSLVPLAVVLCLMAAGSVQAQALLQVNPNPVALSALTGTTTPATQVVSVTSNGDSAGNHLNFYAFVSVGTSWLSIPADGFSGTTPGSITVSANPKGLTNGTYTGQIQVFAAGGASNSPVLVPVTLYVGQLTAAPGSLSFSFEAGGAPPLQQSILVSGGSAPVAFTATTSVSSGSNWLQVQPASASTPATVNVSLNQAVLDTLTPGTYGGAISLKPGTNLPLAVPVTLTVTATPELTVSATSLAFGFQIGGTNNVTQQDVSVTSTGSPATITITSTVDPNPAGTQWLLISNQSSAVTPATFTVGVSPGPLTPGKYTGHVMIAAAGAATVTIDVSLTVSSSPLLSLTPASLTFAYQAGGVLPAAQNIATASTGAALVYTAAASTASGVNWLIATGGGSTPNPTSVSINPVGLGAGTYNGTVTITATNAGNSPQTVPVTLTVTNHPLIEATPNPLTFLYQINKTAPASQTLSLSSSTGDILNYTVTAAATSGGSWLSVTPATGSTAGTVSVKASTAGLAAGTYKGTVTITAVNPTGEPVPNSPLIIPVTYYVSDNALLTVSPASLSFTTTTGGNPVAQVVALGSTSDALNYTISSKTESGGPWLALNSQAGATPGTLAVAVVAFNLSPGTYTGSITVTATNPSGAPVSDSPVVIPVTLQVVIGTLTVSPGSLTFTQTQGGAAPAAQSLNLSGTGAQALSFTAITSTSNGGSWLTVTPTAGNTPATLSVSADGSTLSAGTYTGSITITALNAAGSPQTIPVTLNVAAAPTISLTPAALSFSYQVAGAVPPAQTVKVASSSGALAFTAAVATSASSGNWLAVTPATGTTPGNLSVTVTTASLAAGTYTGTITVTAASAGNSPQSVAVTLVVTPASTPLPTVVQSAASQVPGPIAPGEIISIYGTNLGPATGVGPVIANNAVGTEVAGIQVTFDNIAAPLLYVSATQINAVVPFELNGRFQTHMTVSNNGSLSTALDLTVAPAVPGLFTVSQTGTGPGAILNHDRSVNTASHPAAKGSVIVLYAAGGGETSPPGVTGNITPTDGSGLKDVSGVTVTVGGLDCTIVYAGSAPGFVEGALQINARLPADIPSGAQTVVVKVGTASSPSGVTVAVQ